MNRDFLKELKEICHQVGKVEIIPERLFNIYKVSIPISVNKPIIIGVTRQEAAIEVSRLIKLEQERRDIDGRDTVFIFDVKPMDAAPFEKSIFYNNGPVCV